MPPPPPEQNNNNKKACDMDVEMAVNVGRCQIHEALSGNDPNVEPKDDNDEDEDDKDMLVDYDDDDDDDDDDAEEKDSSGEEDEDEDEAEAKTDNKGEFILVKLADIRKEVQCPICLGIIRKTRTVMECLHRFCRECIDKSMRLGNNECPACRTHCASRRSLRDDPNYDALIAALYPDIDQYEEEEMSFQEDEIERNKQIQAAIAQTFLRQSEALSNKKKKRATATYRRRKNYRSEDEEEANNANDGVKDLSSADERCSEIRSKRSKRCKGQPSSAGASAGGGVNGDEQEANKENTVAPVGLIGSPEMLAWGKGGIRSNTRHGNGAGANSKQNSRSRLAKLGDHLRNLEEYESELEIQVVLISLDRQKASAVHHPYVSSKPSLSVGQLCQYIALQTSLAPERVEILAEKSPCSKLSSYLTLEGQLSTPFSLEAYKDDFHVLDSEETLAGLREATNSYQGHLMLAYREKASA